MRPARRGRAEGRGRIGVWGEGGDDDAEPRHRLAESADSVLGVVQAAGGALEYR